MYPFGLLELVLASYGCYHLVNSFFKRKIEYIELDEIQYNQVKNILSNDNSQLPAYTENQDTTPLLNNQPEYSDERNETNESNINQTTTRNNLSQIARQAPFH